MVLNRYEKTKNQEETVDAGVAFQVGQDVGEMDQTKIEGRAFI